MSEVVKSKTGQFWLWAALTVLALTLALGLNTRPTYAGNADIRDEAGVLNSSAQSNLRSHVSTLPFNVRIVTISSNDTQTRAGNEMNSLGSGLVLVVSPNGHQTTVQSRNIGLNRSQEDNIRNSANNNFKTSDWVGGFNSMLTQAGQVAVVPSTRTGSGSTSNNTSRSSSSGGGFPIFGCLIIGLIALVAFSVFGFGRRRAANNNYNNNPGPGFGGGPGYNNGPGYNQGYGPGYGGGYGPGYNQGGGGIGALGGGAIGAGLGGVVGYELGKEAGRNQTGYNNGGGYVDNGGSSGSYDNGAYTDPGASTGSWGDSGNSSGGWDSGSSSGGSFDSGSSSGSFDTGGSSDWGGGGGDSGGGGGGDSGSW